MLEFKHGFERGIHPEVPFCHVVQHALFPSFTPTKSTYEYERSKTKLKEIKVVINLRKYILNSFLIKTCHILIIVFL